MAAQTPYYDLTNFRNTIYSLNLAIETHYANLLLEGDATRIIYSDNSQALRKRAANQDWNTLYLPFMNYKVSKITGQTDRPWWNHLMNISGIWIEELQRKIRYTPVKVNYESTLFLHRDDSLQYAISTILVDDSNETILKPTITIDGEDLQLYGVLGYNFDYDPKYQESDWLEKNKIHSITLDFEFDYQIIQDNTTGFGIPETVLLEWGRLHNDGDILDDTYQFMVDRFNETVTQV